MIIQKDFPLSQILWYKVGGKAQYLLEVDRAEDIEKALDFVKKNKIQKVQIIGLGSNLIFSDNYFDGAVIRIASSKKAGTNAFQIKEEFITIFAGITFDSLIQLSFKNNLTGLEWAGGLPGTVGAGIRGNVGAFGKEIKDNLFSVDILKRKNDGYELKTFRKSQLNFSYRNSLVKENKNLIIVGATFELQPANPQSLEQAKNIYKSNIKYREKHHPLEYPSCGSVFKNISASDQVKKIIFIWPDTKDLINAKWYGKVSMGYIIGRLGFSGYRSGNMQVSTKHNNFITNLGGGKAIDVLTITKEIQNRVHETFGFIPEAEVEIVNDTK